MSMTLLPCYFPTTVLIIDDNLNQLHSLLYEVDTKHIIPRYYENPFSALRFLNEQYRATNFAEKYCTRDGDADPDSRQVGIDIRKIPDRIFDPNRFSEISVVVVDYNMPGLNGIEFSQELKKNRSKIKVILLTGVGDQQLAIQAFNDRLIDKFIRKDEPNFTHVINQAVKEAQHYYFSDHLAMTLDNIEAQESPFCLTDPVFIKLFNQICNEHQSIEYYLTDSHGSFLLLDRTAQPTWLATKSDRVMQDFYDYVTEEQAPTAVIDAIQNRKMVPYFYTNEDFQTSPDEWQDKFLFPANSLMGKYTYYYSVINNNVFHFNRDDVVAYQQFLEKL